MDEFEESLSKASLQEEKPTEEAEATQKPESEQERQEEGEQAKQTPTKPERYTVRILNL